jgi:hypothetical protein
MDWGIDATNKIVSSRHKLWGSMDRANFWWLPWLPSKNDTCVNICTKGTKLTYTLKYLYQLKETWNYSYGWEAILLQVLRQEIFNKTRTENSWKIKNASGACPTSHTIRHTIRDTIKQSLIQGDFLISASRVLFETFNFIIMNYVV